MDAVLLLMFVHIYFTSHNAISFQGQPDEVGADGGLLLYNVATGDLPTDLIDDPTTAYTDVEIEYGRQRVWWADFGRQQIKSAAYDDLGAISNIQIEGLLCLVSHLALPLIVHQTVLFRKYCMYLGNVVPE